MKKIKIIFLLLIVNICLAQKYFRNESLGFNIEEPANWKVAKNGEIIDNLKKNIKIDSATLNILLEQNKGTIQVVSFYKYPIETTRGMIPTIKISLGTNTAQSFEDFKKVTEESFVGMNKVFPDFKFLINPIKTKISGIDCVKAMSEYTLRGISGAEKIKIIVYSVPVKNQFYKITFMDSESEDNTELYNKLARTIFIY